MKKTTIMILLFSILMIDAIFLHAKTLNSSIDGAKVKDNINQQLYKGEFYSEILKCKKKYIIVLPRNYTQSNKKFPVLYFFHGRGRHEYSLVNIPKALAEFMKASFITVFPDGDASWYINSPVAPKNRYNDYIEELMNHVEQKFRISKKTSQRALSGWSMGGYGCTIFAEVHSDNFSALAPIIALLDYPRNGLPKRQSFPIAREYFGNNEEVWKEYNPINMAEKLRNKDILIITASKCFTLTMNKNFTKKLDDLDIPYQFKVLPGKHSLTVVLQAIPLVVDFMNKKIASQIEANPVKAQ